MATRSDPPTQRAATLRLTRQYVLALVTIVLLGVLSQVVVQVNIAQLSRDTHVIQIAALQRTLSEQLSKAALAILEAQDSATLSTYVNELQSVVPQWEHTNVGLQQGDAAMGLPGQNSPAVTHLFVQIEPYFTTMQDAATNVLVDYETLPPVLLPGRPTLDQEIGQWVQLMLNAEPQFVQGMDAIVAQYQSEADARVQRLQIIEWAILGAEVVVVVALGVLVFRPATRYVGQSIVDLEQAREREHELAALKDQFIVDANHELRTPIMALYNNLEILSALTERGTPEQRTRVLRRALSSGDAVLRLLHNVLDAGALEGKTPRLEPKAVALAPLVHDILETFDPSEIGEVGPPAGEFEARTVTVHVPDELVVWADEGRLRQILINLIANALKYSASGTPIEIMAAASAGAGARARSDQARDHSGRLDDVSGRAMIQVSVRDHGLGVPPRDIPKLFNRFVRLERDIAGSVRGTGVGLYMCRVLVEAMGGRIWVESTGVLGEGSMFSFELPVATPELKAAAELEAVGVTVQQR